MGRPDTEAALKLSQRVKRLRTALDELKLTAQPLGSTSVLTTRVQSSNAVDLEVTNIGYRNKVIEVTYTPELTATSTTGLAYRMEYSSEVSSPLGEHVEALPPEGNQQKWRIYLNGSNTNPVAWARYKFYFYANGTGTFSAALL